MLGIGAVTVDDVFYVERHPAPDTKVPVLARRRFGGGPAATALVAATRLGATTAYAGVLGYDELSTFSMRELERAGVDCGAVLLRPEARPYYAVVIVDRSTGERSILYSNEGVVELREEQVTEELVTACRVLLVDHAAVEAGPPAVAIARAHAIPVVGDYDRVTSPRVANLLPSIDHLILGLQCATALTGESEPAAMVRALAGAQHTCCAVTAGEHGCWYAESGGPVRHLPALRVEAVDTTGCGDVFHGAYAACLARGEPVAMALRAATVAAGMKAMHPGGRNGIPDRAHVERLLRENTLDDAP